MEGSSVRNDFKLAVSAGDLQTVTSLINRHGIQHGCHLLRIAAENNNTEMAELLLSRGCPVVEEIETVDDTPLHLAVRNGNIEITELLLDKGACINDRNGLDETPLAIAVQNGCLRIIKLLLEHGANVNIKEDDDLTLLHSACKNKSKKIVKSLLKGGGDINARTVNDNLTPLHFAVKFGSSDVVNLLLQHGAPVDCEDKHGNTVLYMAVARGELAIVEAVLKFRLDVRKESNRISLKAALCGDGRDFYEIFQALVDYGLTFSSKNVKDPELFHVVVDKGNLQIVGDLLMYGADPNAIDSLRLDGFSPLHRAVQNNDGQMVELLINSKAEINAKDGNGRPPIFYSVENVNLGMMQLLLSQGANVKDFPELLCLAVRKRNVDIIEALLLHGADLNLRDKYGRSALHFTVFDGYEEPRLDINSHCSYKENQIDIRDHLRIVQFLLDKGANVHAQTSNGLTTLHASIDKGFDAMVDLLLRNKASPHLGDKDGTTPLHIAAVRGNLDVCARLLNKNADINTKRKDGNTALHLAFSNGHEEIVKLLLNSGADIYDNNRNLALHLAISHGHEEIVKLLRHSGADMNATDGNLALHLAISERHEEVVKLLLHSGAQTNCEGGDGVVPLHLAVEKANAGIVVALLKSGANVNFRDRKGETALHVVSSRRPDVNIVAALLEYGADVNIPIKNDSQFSLTPLDCAWIMFRSVRRFYPVIKSQTVDYLFKHYIKMKAAGLYVTEPVSEIRLCENFRHFHSECQPELIRMKTEFIANTNVSYGEILKCNACRMGKLMKNENIVFAVESEDYKEKFPLYATLIKAQFQKGLANMKLTQSASPALHRLSKLPKDCIEKILDFLTDDDLKVLIQC